MTATIAVLALQAQFAYSLTGETSYQMAVSYDGYLPLLGGVETRAEVALGFTVRGQGGSEASSALTAFKVSLLEKATGEMKPLPLTLDNARAFFPESTVSFKPTGEILGTTARDTRLPLRLPGLHAKHLPDMTFLILQFPEEPFEKGSSWKFSRKFDDSPLEFTAAYLGKEQDGHKFELKMLQTYETYEDTHRNETTKEKAAANVQTKVDGSGFVWFDGGKIVKCSLTANADSRVISLAGEPERKRSLKTQVNIKEVRG